MRDKGEQLNDVSIMPNKCEYPMKQSILVKNGVKPNKNVVHEL